MTHAQAKPDVARLLWLIFLVTALLTGCGILATPTLAPTNTPSPSPTMTMTMTMMPTNTPSPSPTMTMTMTPAPIPLPCPQQKIIDAVVALPSDYPFPEHLAQEDAVKTGKEFDVNEYLTVLEHLSMEPGYILDYVYRLDFMGGEPVLYARPEDQPPFATYSEYESENKVVSGESYYEYLDHVQTDGTKDGFFEFVVLYTVANQFYLSRHSYYNDASIVCDHERLENIVTDSSEAEFGSGLSTELQQQARSLDLEPRVEIKDDTVMVRVVIFTKWGGFIEGKYTISRSFPHSLLEVDTTTLVPYDCGINF